MSPSIQMRGPMSFGRAFAGGVIDAKHPPEPGPEPGSGPLRAPERGGGKPRKGQSAVGGHSPLAGVLVCFKCVRFRFIIIGRKALRKQDTNYNQPKSQNREEWTGRGREWTGVDGRGRERTGVPRQNGREWTGVDGSGREFSHLSPPACPVQSPAQTELRPTLWEIKFRPTPRSSASGREWTGVAHKHCALRVARCALRVARWPRWPRWALCAACCALRVARCALRVARCALRVARCGLRFERQSEPGTMDNRTASHGAADYGALGNGRTGQGGDARWDDGIAGTC
jgi:hypothetical protein